MGRGRDKGQTSKPCHGCGRQSLGWPNDTPRVFRGKEEVCDDCQELLELGQLYKDRIAEVAKSLDFHQVAAMRQKSDYPYWVFPTNVLEKRVDREKKQALVVALDTLARASSVRIEDVGKIPRPPEVNQKTGEPLTRPMRYGDQTTQVVREEIKTVDSLGPTRSGLWDHRDFGNTVARYGWATLTAAITEVVRSAYATGRRDGSSILARLASGEVSQAEFDAIRTDDD